MHTAVWALYLFTAISNTLIIPGTYETRAACEAAAERNNKALDAGKVAAVTVCLEGIR